MKYLKKFRQAFELDQDELGLILGAPQSTYSRWERGQSDPPKEIRQLLADLGLNLHWLDTGEGEMLQPGVKLEVGVKYGRKQLRRVDRGKDSETTLTGNPVHGLPALESRARIEVTPVILPSMVALAAQMVDAVIQAMPPENRPADSARWEAYATIARFLAQEKAEGKEGLARTFLLGLKVEWAEARTESGA